ncbi:hypothetical protein F4778DRAFT_721007 [Xylariomycetidae sp. FL2044]|nr:hypothetical protein F4778DRAFT_721007 [Xylariomycetidae sp. FL2044]
MEAFRTYRFACGHHNIYTDEFRLWNALLDRGLLSEIDLSTKRPVTLPSLKCRHCYHRLASISISGDSSSNSSGLTPEEAETRGLLAQLGRTDVFYAEPTPANIAELSHLLTKLLRLPLTREDTSLLTAWARLLSGRHGAVVSVEEYDEKVLPAIHAVFGLDLTYLVAQAAAGDDGTFPPPPAGHDGPFRAAYDLGRAMFESRFFHEIPAEKTWYRETARLMEPLLQGGFDSLRTRAVILIEDDDACYSSSSCCPNAGEDASDPARVSGARRNEGVFALQEGLAGSLRRAIPLYDEVMEFVTELGSARLMAPFHKLPADVEFQETLDALQRLRRECRDMHVAILCLSTYKEQQQQQHADRPRAAARGEEGWVLTDEVVCETPDIY